MKALVLVAAILSPFSAFAQSTNSTVPTSVTTKVAPIPVVPGKSVGKIWLGAPRETVLRLMGKPTVSESRSKSLRSGDRVDTWFGPPLPQKAPLDRHYFGVMYRKDRVIQIWFNSPNYRTAQGISSQSSLAQFRKVYRVQVRSYLFRDEDGGGGSRFYTHDDVKRGITFTWGGQDNYDARALPENIVVHRRGVPMVIDARAKRLYVNDEVPVGKGAM